MDKLDKIFKMQEELDNIVAQKYGLCYPNHINDGEVDPETFEQVLSSWINAHCNAMQVELSEVLEEAQYKWWKTYTEPINQDKVKEELIDVFHFLLGLMIKLKMSPDDIVKAYVAKNEINHVRQKKGGRYE